MAIKQMLASALSHTRNIVPPAKTWRGAKLRKRLGTGLAIAAAGLALVAANPIVPAATAGTIRSGTGTDACTVDVGNTGYATVAKNGNYCITTVTNSTTVTMPGYVSSIAVMAVGAGGGGGTDGGSGGGGGEARYSNSQTVTGGSAATITIGAGGSGGVWGGAAAGNGTATYISGAGMSYGANAGAGGGSWSAAGPPGGAAGSGGYGGTGLTGGSGGYGSYQICTTGSVGNAGNNVGITAVSAAYYGGGGGGATSSNSQNAGSAILGAAGGAGGGGRGANYKLALDDVTAIVGASYGHSGTANTGGGGGAGSACDAGNTNGVNQRTPGGAGGSGVVVMSWLANKLAIAQAPDGCVSNVAEACLVPAKVQVQDSNGSNLATSGVTVTLVSSSVGTPGGTTSVTTDSNGVATFSNIWITGAAVGNTPTLTFETPGYRNVQGTTTLYQYADTLNVVAGSTDTAGSFFGATGVWLATASTSNISVTTLQNQLATRDVTLRASSASTSTTAGDVMVASTAVISESASAARSSR